MRWIVSIAVLCAAHVAHAFCGFYVAGGDQQMFNDATQVVLMREGTRTVLSMQNNYKGPPEAFAMVIPVPVVLHEGDVKTLSKDVFEHVEKMGAPRLVEYWEQDPCMIEPPPPPMAMPSTGRGAMLAEDKAVEHLHGVTIEAQFVVGEYQIVILSAKDSTGLETWLHEQSYKIPDGAEPLLRPYVEQNMKFFVAKVDPKKVHFVDGRAALSPIRFHYETEDFVLPIRLGLANSSGTQDLIVNIFSPNQRYQVANYKNVFIPTNIDVDEKVKDKFGAFYAALFDRTVEKNPGAVVTEYAWAATTCDPCPGPTLRPDELQALGGDIINDPGYGLVLTRLHARYGKNIVDDLHFAKAAAVVGGREFVQTGGKLEEGARPDSNNNFQGRYAIRHEWTGPLTCQNPIRHRWGGPPGSYGVQPPTPATGLAFAPRNEIALPEVVKRDLPEIDVKMASAKVVGAPVDTQAKPDDRKKPVAPAATETKKSGCGCSTGDPQNGLLVLALAAMLRPSRRRRR